MINTFMHYRKFDRKGQIMARGGMTLAIQVDGSQVTVALAECGRKDNFNRKLGRQIASGRLSAGKESSHVHVITLPEMTKVKSFVHAQDFVQERVKKLLSGGK